jgi:lipid-A-disaccharide synthase
LICAGEPSGERHAAAVVEALRARHAPLDAVGVGGAAMARAGVRLLARIDELSAMGLVEVVRTLPRHRRVLATLRRELRTGTYDLAILVDYPGFHLRVAAEATRAGVPVLYYVAPQMWAWGGWRLRALRSRVQRLAVILPFEESFFADRGIPATFVGHPALEHSFPARADARRHLGLDPERPLLALFPGSRRAERQRLDAVFRRAATLLQRDVPELAQVVADRDVADGAAPAGRVPAALALAAADVGLVKSGTTTLEAALAGLPMVVAYRMHPVTFAVARRAVHVPHVSLVNLVAARDVAPEFLQRRATPERLYRALRELLPADAAARRRQLDAFDDVRRRLGTPGASGRVADLALELAA